jgi:hypothetical protein
MVEAIIIAILCTCILLLAKKVNALQNKIHTMDYNQFMNSMNYELDNTNENETPPSKSNVRILQ